MESLGEFALTFNGEIDLAEGAKASLYEDDTLVKEASLTVDAADGAVARADFGDEPLYRTHTYRVVVEEGQAFPKGKTDGGNSRYTATYTGAAWRPLEATVRPGQNRTITSLAEIDINPRFPNGYGFVSTGKEHVYTARLLKGGVDGESVADLTLGLTETMHLCVTSAVPLESNTTYTVIVPEGQIIPYEIGVSGLKANEEYRQYEWVFSWRTAAAPVEVHASSVSEGSSLASLGLAAFYVGGATSVADGASMRLMRDGAPVREAAVSLADVGGRRVAVADFSDADHSPLALEENASYTLVLPQGSLMGEDGVVANEEGSVQLTGPAAAADPVFHNVTLSLDNAAAQTSAVEEGRTVSFLLTPADELWKVGEVTNATLDETSGEYVTAPVTADTEVRASFALVNPVEFDYTTEVEEIDVEIAYLIHSDGNNIVVNGVAGGDRIRVYTPGGTLMADRTVPEGMDTASISLDHGVYIVAVNDHVYKVKH